MRFQGFTSETDDDGVVHVESSAYVQKDDNDPRFLIDGAREPSLTRQEFALDCDINHLMAQYEKTGVVNHFNNGVPRYLDVTEVPNLQEGLHILREASVAFYRLPALVRREFDNDPAQFVEFAGDPKNLEKMREWGLAPPAPTEPPPQKVEIINLQSGDNPKD